MKVNKWFKVAALATTIGLGACMVTGCGKSSSASENSDTITFMFRGAEDEKKAYQAAIDEFEKKEKRKETKRRTNKNCKRCPIHDEAKSGNEKSCKRTYD